MGSESPGEQYQSFNGFVPIAFMLCGIGIENERQGVFLSAAFSNALLGLVFIVRRGGRR
ncbi:hypothetical protein NA56DRAFT_648123 [Hyaloscypha hepaticicola]|uniref:Uncharacterized protein n=1 Tax=Hyaloscypha hepaticicola TaxID=2082293 RepID=A0A2J6PWG9_9HELO|nr:hypothetical protein NA56DRAFT_648123 [Hyaloscypha hepaticicola]